jgi:SAM-dependent methyltransferase
VASNTGFSNVDASGRAGELVDYLGLLAARLTDFRREGYELLGLEPGMRVLDVGCGAGEVCVELAARVGPEGGVAGIDLSEAMIDAARRASAAVGCAIDWRVASAYELPFADQSFDAVRAERVLQHLEHPERALAEMRRVTRAGGRILVVDPDHGQMGLALDDPAQRRVFEAVRRALLAAIVNPHSGVNLGPLLRSAGLTDVRVQGRVLEVGAEDFARLFFLHDLLDALVASGELSGAQARDFIEALRERAAAGNFYSNAVGYNAVARRPA